MFRPKKNLTEITLHKLKKRFHQYYFRGLKVYVKSVKYFRKKIVAIQQFSTKKLHIQYKHTFPYSNKNIL